MFSLLYIDDEPGLLELGKLFLESTGEFEVGTALSADAGLEQLAQQDFDAIVSDFQMPGMDGIELLKRVRKSFGTIPFVLFTGRGREEVVIEAINNGVDFYLQKGGDPKAQFAELAHKVRQAVTRRRAEIALSDSEQRLADIINFLPDATFAIDTRGVVIAWNRAMERMTGSRSDDVLGKGDYEYALPFYHERRPLLINLVLDDDPAIARRYPVVKKEGRTLFSEITIPHFNDGRGAALWFTASPLYNRNGDMVGAIESIREITERKQAEESLVSANREYTNLLDQIQDIYYRSDTEGRLVRASRSLATLLGYDDISECIGRSIADDFYFNPSDRKEFLEAISKNGKVTGYDVLLKKKDGRPVLVEASSHLNFDPAGNIIGIEGTFRDITERKRAEEELRAANEQLVASEEELQAQYNELAASEERIRQSEQKYRTVFETTGTAMLMIEDDATISLVNAEFSRLCGYTREEIENKKRWTEFVVREDRDRMLAQHRLRRENREDALQRYEFRFVTRSGEIRDIFLSIDVVPGTRKSVASLLDITEKKKADDELLAANEQLAASSEELRAQYNELAQSEKRIRLSEMRLTYMLGFYEHAQRGEKELLEYAIEGAGIVTGSPLGYLAFLNEDESELAMYAWSKNAMAECSMQKKPIVYKTEKTGLWGEAVRQRRPVITNDYTAPNPAKKGYPEGHPQIIRHMNVPVIDEGHIVLVGGVSNKSSDYSDNDVSELTLLMQGLWTILKRKRAEQKEQNTVSFLNALIDQNPDSLWISDDKGFLIRMNAACSRLLHTSEAELAGKYNIFNDNIVEEQGFMPLVRSVFDEGRVVSFPLIYESSRLESFPLKDNINLVLDVTIFPIKDAAGTITNAVIIHNDVTERKRAETELKAAYEQVTAADEELREQYDSLAAAQAEISSRRQQLEEIASTVPGVVYQFYARPGGSMGMYYVSSRADDVFGISSSTEDFFGRFTECVDPRDREKFLRSITDATGAGLPWKFEGRFVRPTAETIWFEGISRPVRRGNELVYNGVLLDITERKRAENALRENEEKYRSLVENIPFGITLIDADHRIIISNTAQGQMFHTHTSLWAGRYCYREFEKRDAVCTHCPGTRAMATGVCHVVETEGVRDDGTRFNARIHAIPLLDTEGKATRFIEVVEDITERKKVEDALRQNEEKYRTLVETTGTGFVILDDRGCVLDANPEYVRMTGHTRLEDISGRSVTEWTAAHEQERNADAVRQCIRDGFIRNFEVDYTDNSGAITPVEINATVLQSEGSVHILTLCRDITERKRVENELLRLKISTDRSSDEIFWMDFAGNILYVNDAACRITGYSREEFLKMKIFELDPDFQQAIWDASVADLREKKTQFITTRHRRKDGVIIDVEIVAVYVNQYDQEYSFAYVRDVTERRRTEDALFSSQQMLQLVLDAIPQRVFWKDRNSVYLGCNMPLARDAGYNNPKELVGKDDFDTDYTATADLYRADDLRVMETGESRINYEEPQIRSDGSQAWLRTTKVPLRDKTGTIIGVLGTYEDITDRKKAEEAIRDSEEKYRTLVESSFDGIAIHQDGILVFINRTAAQILGSENPGDFIGKPAIDIVAPAFRDQIAGRVERSPEQALELIHEQFLRLDGSAIDVDVTTTPTTWQGRQAAYVTFRDITAQVHAEEALRESEEKYRMLVETTSDFIWEVDAGGKYTYVSPQVRQIFGYEPEELVGKTPFDIMPPQEAERIDAEFSRYIAARLPIIALENKALRKDGSMVILETSGAVRTGPDGRYQGYRGIDRDITIRKKAEEALREKTEELNRFFTASLDLFCIAEDDGYFRRLNPEWEKTLGYTLEELEGHRFLDFVHPDDLQATLATIADLAKEMKVLNFTNRYRHKDGSYRWIEWRSLPVGTLIFAAARDITARHDAAERTKRISALKQDLLWTAPLEEKLKQITDGIVDIFGADFARIWIASPGDLCDKGCIHAVMTNGAHACQDRKSCLHLIVSSGRYTHTDGGHRRVPFGAYKIGRIASGDDARFITNDVTHDPRVHDHAWAESLGLVSFSGFRLVSAEGHPIGVLALFSREPVTPALAEDLEDLATTASQVVQTDMAEQALRESEARLTSILHGSPVLQFVIDRNHRVISWNNALEEYSGIRAADIIGTDQQWHAFYPGKRPVLADLLVDGDINAISRLYEGKFRKSRYVEGAYEATDFFPHMGSSGVWLSFTAAPIRDNQEVIIGAVETLEDVTERVNAENALRESEERSRTILNTAQAGIVLVDADTHEIVDANKKALELIGLDRESVIGEVCHHFICPAEEGKCPVTDLGQQVDTSERILITATGEKIPVLKTVVPVSIGGRSVLVESFVDIAEQKRSEAAIREANRKLNLLNSITRHDIRNQLMVAQGFTQLAALSKPDATVLDFLAKITAAIETIQRQIEFTKAYQELGVHAPSWFLVDEVISSVRPGKIALRNSCKKIEIFADPMIDNVFFNLFDNAVKYGERVTTVTVGCEEIDDYLVITFADNGCGIPPGEKKKIFEKGFGKNTGLGLFLAREILAITGITIHENGTFGEGAAFEIIIPKGAYRRQE